MIRNPTDVFFERQILNAQSSKKAYLINKQVEELQTQAKQVLLTQQYSPIGTLARQLNNTRYEDFSNVDNIIESEISDDMRSAKSVGQRFDKDNVRKRLVFDDDETDDDTMEIQGSAEDIVDDAASAAFSGFNTRAMAMKIKNITPLLIKGESHNLSTKEKNRIAKLRSELDDSDLYFSPEMDSLKSLMKDAVATK